MKTFLATLVAAAVLATAVVSVRLHLGVAQLRYHLWSLDEDRVRAERALQLARADLEAAKAPRRLLERWAELRGDASVRTSLDPAAAARTAADEATEAARDDRPADAGAAADDADAMPAGSVPPPPPPPTPAPDADPANSTEPREGGR